MKTGKCKMCSAPFLRGIQQCKMHLQRNTLSNKLFVVKRQSSSFQGTFPRAFNGGSGRTTVDPLGRSTWCVDKV